MKKRWYPLVIVASCLCFPLAAAGAAVYKWTDAQGVHFSDRPDDAPAAHRIELDVAPRGTTPPAPPAPPAESAEDAEPDPEARPLQADAAAQRENRDKNCEIARSTLEHNQGIGRMYRLGPDGERVFLSDEEREQVLHRSREDVAKWCDD